MGTKINSNYSDLLTFTRASKGHALRPVSYGTELVTNGDFSSTDLSDWSSYSGGILTLESGELKLTGNAGDITYGATQTINTVVGKVYKITINTRTSGTAYLRVGTTSGGFTLVNESTTSSANVTLAAAFVASSTSTVITLQGSANATSYFDNVSVKEVTFDESDGTLTLFEHPNNVPRVEWDADRNRLGLLVEELRTNEFNFSEAFNESNWDRVSGYAAPTLPFTEQSPTKVANSAATLIDDNGGGTGQAYIRALANGIALSTPHTFSVFAKKDQLSWVALEAKFFSVPTATVYFDLDAGTVGTATNCTGAIQEYPDGWYRCSLTFTSDSSDAGGYGYIYLADGDGVKGVDRDGTSSIFIFGAQFEEGSFTTSYIKNEGTAGGKDRSADVASIPVADFGYNQSAGSVVVEAKSADVGVLSSYAFDLFEGANEFISGTISNGSYDLYIKDSVGGMSDKALNSTATVSANTFIKHASGFNTSEAVVVIDETASSEVALTSLPSPSELHIGSRGNNTKFTNGHIKSIKYYPRRLSDAQLVELTS